MELLKIESKEDKCIYLIFENYNDLSKAKGIIENAIVEWSDNCLEGFIQYFDFLDDETKPMYQCLIDNNIHSELDYIYFCLDNEKIDYKVVNCSETIEIISNEEK